MTAIESDNGPERELLVREKVCKPEERYVFIAGHPIVMEKSLRLENFDPEFVRVVIHTNFPPVFLFNCLDRGDLAMEKKDRDSFLVEKVPRRAERPVETRTNFVGYGSDPTVSFSHDLHQTFPIPSAMWFSP